MGRGEVSYVKYKSDMLNTLFIFMFRIFAKIVQTLKMERRCSGRKVECSCTVFTKKTSGLLFQFLVLYLGNFGIFRRGKVDYNAIYLVSLI